MASTARTRAAWRHAESIRTRPDENLVRQLLRAMLWPDGFATVPVQPGLLDDADRRLALLGIECGIAPLEPTDVSSAADARRLQVRAPRLNPRC